MPRQRLIDFMASRAPKVLGFCQDDRVSAASYANSAERRLVLAKEAGDEGWWGTWAEVQFNHVSRSAPFLSCSRRIARIEKINVCNRPVRLQNQFYEYLDFGNGRLPKQCQNHGWCDCSVLGLTRNNSVTQADQTVSPCYIRVYCADPADATGSVRRVLVQGYNDQDVVVYSMDETQQVIGEFVNLDLPFRQTTSLWNRFTGFQKDVTSGDVQIFQVDPATGEERLLLVMEPSETVAGYRRYYLNDLPRTCCCRNTGTETDLTVSAIVKLEMIPAVVDTDYLLLHNIEAYIEESISVRMSEMDNAEAMQLAAIHHVGAIRLLNSEITHYLGKQSPAVNFAPFGTAHLEHQRIGTLI